MQRHTWRAILIAVLIILVSLILASSAWGGYKALYKFRVRGGDGTMPTAGVTFDSAGNLYGTTASGGAHNIGTVYKLSPQPDGSWTESVLYSFEPDKGDYPSYAGVTLDAAGNIYGTNESTVFKLIPNPDGTWTYHVLHRFTNTPDGFGAKAGVIFDSAGNLYGTTERGGTYGIGTVYEMTPNPDGSWTEFALYSFGNQQSGGRDGALPITSLVLDTSGDLYGTASRGGLGDTGTVFRLVHQQDGRRVFHVFAIFSDVGDRKDFGSRPSALILDAAGNLYGTTYEGGKYGFGTVFRLRRTPKGWKGLNLHSFSGHPAKNSNAPLVFDTVGNLYGTTQFGGDEDYFGTAFRLSPSPDGSWKSTTIHRFHRSNGAWPMGNLVMDHAGNLYGTTFTGGRTNPCTGYGCGTVFRITP